jgi:ankyrin repeat protein/nucleoside phosphorylase
MELPRVLSAEDYRVGWMCALAVEMAAARKMLDEEHGLIPQHPKDANSYILGRLGVHNVVMTCLPDGGTGKTSAAIASHHMSLTFPHLRMRLMVGIGGGVPNPRGKDIRLGDVVVSNVGPKNPGVVQYDFGKTIQNGRFERTGTLNKPPRLLRNAVTSLQARHMKQDADFSNRLLQIATKAGFDHPTETDVLYEAAYDHPRGRETCSRCNSKKIVKRRTRNSKGPAVFLGLIASGDQVMRWGVKRDALWEEMKIDCFEMESAGLMEDDPFLIIRGISDYADSHKNKAWQPYAAATAAAYAKELLMVISATSIPYQDVGSDLSEELVPYSRQLAPRLGSASGHAWSTFSSLPMDRPPERLETFHSAPILSEGPAPSFWTEPLTSRDDSSYTENALDTSENQTAEAQAQAAEKTQPLLISHPEPAAAGDTVSAARDQVLSNALKLEFAAEDGDGDEVFRLLEGLRPGERLDGAAALHQAAVNGHADVVFMLLDYGPDPEAGGIHGRSPLYMAARQGHVEVIKVLQTFGGANINFRDDYGWTPLHAAASRDHEEVVRHLIESGAEIDARDSTLGLTPLHGATEQGHIATARLLVSKGASVNIPNASGSTPFHTAVYYGYLDMVRMLIGHGADLETTSSEGYTPLHTAASFNYAQMIKILLEHGADIEATNGSGVTPLHVASHWGHAGAVKALLKADADTEAVGSDVTSLVLAVWEGHEEVVGLLLEHGADVHVRDSEGQQPLHIAAALGYLGMVKQLLSHGADIDAKDAKGRSPTFQAAHNGHMSVSDLLERKRAEMGKPGTSKGSQPPKTESRQTKSKGEPKEDTRGDRRGGTKPGKKPGAKPESTPDSRAASPATKEKKGKKSGPKHQHKSQEGAPAPPSRLLGFINGGPLHTARLVHRGA